MSAQPTEHRPPEMWPTEYGPPGMWPPDPVRQKLANHTLEDVLNLPTDAPRVELVNGVMLVVPSPTVDHQDISGLLWTWLRAHAPSEYKATFAVGVAVSANHAFEPDLVLHRAGGDGSRHYLVPEQVVLVVEVVSPHTKRRDRFVKPAEYAAAGIPYYWRVEQNPVHIHAYRRAAAGGSYELVADSAELLTLDEPFPIKLAVADITP